MKKNKKNVKICIKWAKIIDLLKKIKENHENNKKWTLYLYLKGQCIKSIKIDKDFAPMGKIYVMNVKNKRHLLGTNRKTQLVVRSYKYKYTDEAKKTAHIEVIIYEGSDIA